MSTDQITVLGATGSIGLSTLDVIARHPDRYSVYALTARSNVEKMVELCEQFLPTVVVMLEDEAADKLQIRLRDLGLSTQVKSGASALVEVASAKETDQVMAAIVGAAGLESSLAAAKAGKRLLLANKEALVMSGTLFMNAVKDHGATLLPIDSEHNAIFQCLANGAEGYRSGVEKILLTGSGGPFRQTPLEALASVTPDQACAHPNWSMGRKISVDSATMMNKGLELIEAKWLFGLPASQIEIVLHPESVIHSMVAYADGSVLAQMGNPDMRTPIAHAMAWPERVASGVPALDLVAQGKLTFEPLDRRRFPCVEFAEQAARSSDSLAIALNAANEVAVEAFLGELIRFPDIPKTIENVLGQTSSADVSSISDILEIDEAARVLAREYLQQIGQA